MMLTLKDLSEIPFINTLWVAICIITSVCPSNIVLYYFEPIVFRELDFFKLLLITSSVGLCFFTVNATLTWFFISRILTSIKKEEILSLNQNDLKEHDIKNFVPLIMLTANVFIGMSLLACLFTNDYYGVKSISKFIHNLICFQLSIYLMPFLFLIVRAWMKRMIANNEIRKNKTN